MTPEIAAIVDRARQAADSAPAAGRSAESREKLTRIAQEFESMLLVQVLRDMRRAGEWKEDGEDAADTLGAEAFFETLDLELASHLARAKGLGLSQQLMQAFERLDPQSKAGPGADAVVQGTLSSLVSGLSSLTPSPESRAPRSESPVSSPEARVPSAESRSTIPDPRSPMEVLRPVEGAVTSSFGWRRDPFTDRLKFHQGVDLRAAYGQEVQAAGAGRVVFSGEQGGYGAAVMIEHEDGTRTRYAHLSARLVEKGDQVAAGAPLGRAGHSGRATGTHLHFEVIAKDGRRVQPEQWARAFTPGGTGAAD